jgi:hypothetical protein
LRGVAKDMPTREKLLDFGQKDMFAYKIHESKKDVTR